MAKEATIQKLEEELNCSVCLDTYTNPKLLQCFHTYCQQCLVPLVDRDQQGQLGLTCPACRQVTPIPPSGVRGLQPAFHINRLLEIQESVKKIPEGQEGQRAAGHEEAAGQGSTSTRSCCFEHAEEELKLYCNTCEDLICFECALQGGKHHDHKYEQLKTTFERYKGEIASSLEPIEKQVTAVNEALARLDARCMEISDQRASVEANVHQRIGRLHRALDARETELIHKLDTLTQAKLKELAAQRDLMASSRARMTSCLEFMKKSIHMDSEGEVLRVKSAMAKQVNALTTPLGAMTLEPNAEADIAFLATKDMIAQCQNYGQVFAQHSPDPSKCYATGKGLEAAVAGEESTATVHAVSFEGTPCREPVKLLECELVSVLTGGTTRGSAERRDEGLYDISYQPTIKGRHQLNIGMEGQHIRGSPFTVLASRSPADEMKNPILTIHTEQRPWGVALTKQGEIVVTSFSQHCVTVFSPSGDKVLAFGTCGSRDGEFVCPKGVAVDGEGNILVVDSSNHRIQKFTREGHFITAVGSKGSGPLQFSYPSGIAVSEETGKVYVAGAGVQVLNPDLTFSGTFGRNGYAKGQFTHPYDVACGRTGLVYIASDSRVQAFSAEEEFLKICGIRLDDPAGIAVDSSGIVYVSERDHISTFTPEGARLLCYLRCTDPYGLAVDRCGVVYVCDFSNARIQLF